VSPASSHEDQPATSPAATRIARTVVLAPIVVYRRVLSPALPQRCKYEPTCSRYAVDAIREYGILRGLVLGVWRLLRCNPWSHGGYDPVEDQRLFKAGPDPGPG
jgi:putative membrane protein insertion efficiency factor